MNKSVQLKDLPEAEVLEACRKFHGRQGDTPDVVLSDRYPVKIILGKMQKMVDKGLLEYGVSLRTAWVAEDRRVKQ